MAAVSENKEQKTKYEEMLKKYNVTTELRLITPEEATEMLTHNRNNRPINSERVRGYVREIRKGNWEITHQGVGFDENGRLIDGQHRLRAIEVSGIPVPLMVTRGLPPRAGAIVDIGQKRTTSQSLKMLYGDNAPNAAISGIVIAGVRKVLTYNMQGGSRSDVNDYESMVDNFAAEMEMCRSITGTTMSRVKAEITGAILAALIGGERERTVRDFFEVVGKNTNTEEFREQYNIQVAWDFRKRLEQQDNKTEKINSRQLYNMAQCHIYCFGHKEASMKELFPDMMTATPYDIHDMIELALTK